MSSKGLIDSIASSVERLIGENRRLRGEVERLEAARVRLREENRRLTALNVDLERRITVRELATGFADGRTLDRHGVKVARARVNRLVREVDKCIALLNK
ncbi:MAG: hypothetical protein LBV38_02930 [Alistipes sp.]|jgi:hypothetical protein|nr:hypothetical protein [Alistipes sp.]